MPIGSRPRRAASLSDMRTQAEAPSDSWLALPAVMNSLSPRTGLSFGEAVERGVGPVAFVLRERDGSRDVSAGVLVGDRLRRWQRHDLARRDALALRRGGALLALQRVCVLRARG